MTWVFFSFLITPCALASCHILICKQDDDSTIRALGYNRRITGRRSRDENQTVQSSVGHTDDRRRSDELVRGCKRWHPLAPGRRYGKKRSSLS